jgi:hypothetical protein
MSDCGCKGNKPKQEKIVPPGITPLVIQQVETPAGYTLEDIIKLKDYVSSTNKTESQRFAVQEILSKYFGDVVPAYCDQVCIKFIKDRAMQMEAKLK